MTSSNSDNVFFLVLNLFTEGSTVYFKDNYTFPRFQREFNFFQGVQLFPGGSDCLFPIESHITCSFPGGGVWTP